MGDIAVRYRDVGGGGLLRDSVCGGGLLGGGGGLLGGGGGLLGGGGGLVGGGGGGFLPERFSGPTLTGI